jgi:outer membrane protein TolC
MKSKILALIGFFIFQNTLAQDTLMLFLQTAMDSSIQNNREILLAKLDEKTAVAQFNQTKAVFLPQVNLSYTAATTNNPLNAFAFRLQQQSVSSADFDPRLLNHPPTTQNYMTKVEWNQPLLNLDMVYKRRAAEQQINVNHYKTERIKEYVMFEVQMAYAQLQVAYHAVAVLNEALNTAKSIYKTSINHFEKGYLKKSDLLAVQVQIASTQTKLAEARSKVRNASDYLGLLMGSSSGPIYIVEPLEKSNTLENFPSIVPEGRADLKALNSELMAQETMINSTKLSRLPKLNAFANYMFNDNTAFGFGSDSYLIGAQFSWTLFNGTATQYRTAEQKIAYSRIEQQLTYQREQSQLEINNTFRQLTDNEFALRQYEASVAHATEALRILQNRFEQGMTSTDDVLQSQSTLSEQKFLLTETIFKYNTTLSYLQFLTSTSENKF